MQQRRQKGLKFYDAKMNPARRSRSLEGNLDNIDVDHVTFREGDKGKALHNSHSHSLDVNKSNQQRGSARFSASHILGRRLQIIATPTSSSSPPPTTSSSPTLADIIKANVETEVSYQPKQQHVSSGVNSPPLSEHMTQQHVQSGQNSPHLSEAMTKEDQQLKLQDEEAVGTKSEGTKMTRSAHTQCSFPDASGGETTIVLCSSAKTCSQLASRLPPKTNYPDSKTAKTDDNAFRERTDAANSAMFDISYDL